jgi:hypothetical protein
VSVALKPRHLHNDGLVQRLHAFAHQRRKVNIMNQPNLSSAAIKSDWSLSLMDVFNFTAEDLAANRGGVVTPRQLEQLRTTQRNSATLILIVIGVMVAFIGAYLVLSPQGKELRAIVTQNPTIALVGIGGTLFFYLLMLLVAARQTRSMTGGKAQNTSGKLKMVGRAMQGLDGTAYQRIKIGRRNFVITTQQASVMSPGANYSVYFTGGGQMAKIISLEQAA